MKRLLTGLLALALAASLTACGREAPPEDGRLRAARASSGWTTFWTPPGRIFPASCP